MPARIENIEAEKAYLGAVFFDNAVLDGSDGLCPPDFSREKHQLVLHAMQDLRRKGEAVDYLTVEAYLKKRKQLSKAGGAAYLAGLVDGNFSSVNADSYRRIIQATAARRRVIASLAEAQQRTENGDPLDLVVDDLTRAVEENSLIGQDQLRCVTVPEVLALDIQPREWIIEPVLRTKDLWLLYGWRGVGKSWAGIYVALAVASGGILWDKWKVVTPRGVLYIDGELPLEEVQKRIVQLMAGCNLEPGDNLKIISADDQDRPIPSLSEPKGQALVEAHLDGVQLLVIDNLSTLAPVPENDSQEWEGMQRWLLSLRRRGISVIVLHHAGKAGQQRGTSRREDVLDATIALREPKDYTPSEGCRFELHFEKSRGLTGSAVLPFEAKLTTDSDGKATWSTDDLAEATRAKVVELRADGMTQQQIADVVGCNKSTVCRILKRAGESME